MGSCTTVNLRSYGLRNWKGEKKEMIRGPSGQSVMCELACSWSPSEKAMLHPPRDLVYMDSSFRSSCHPSCALASYLYE